MEQVCHECGGAEEIAYTCTKCNGTGMGEIDGFRCYVCSGSGSIIRYCRCYYGKDGNAKVTSVSNSTDTLNSV